jgi:predicted RNA-binding Zn-ribbon protein involved in translation (DUF1610 family)
MKSTVNSFHSRVQEKLEPLRHVSPGSEAYDAHIEHLLDALPYLKSAEEDTGNHGPVDPQSPQSIQQFLEITGSSSTKDIYLKYLAEVEHEEEASWHVIQEKDDMVCFRCGGPLRINTTESVVICPQCGTATTWMEGSTRNLNYHEQMEYGSKRQYTYKRLSHLIETLNAVQGKENTSIPADVMEAMHQEIKKNRMSVADLQPRHIRQFLKRRGMPKLYEHTATILGLLQGRSQKIPEHIERELKNRFLALQKPFQRVCEDDTANTSRRNMLRYNYIIYKLLQMIPGGEEYLHLFPLLKSRTKLKEHDDMWKKLIDAIDDPRGGWVFHPTI